MSVFGFDKFKECLRLFAKERREQKTTESYFDEVYYRSVKNLPNRRVDDKDILEIRRKINIFGDRDAKRNDRDTIKRQLLGEDV